MLETDQAQPKKTYWQNPNNWVSILTLLAVLTYTGIQAWQTHLLSSNNVVSQRAFVNFSLNVPYISADVSGPKALNFLTAMTNSGNTPTKNLTVALKCATSTEDVKDPWLLLYQGQPPPADVTPEFLGPHASVPLGCSFSYEQVLDIIAGKLFGYMLVDISYRDRLDDTIPHKTQVSWKLSQIAVQSVKVDKPTEGAIPGQLQPGGFAYAAVLMENRGRHNCADEECPN